jgi:hypothetical protein
MLIVCEMIEQPALHELCNVLFGGFVGNVEVSGCGQGNPCRENSDDNVSEGINGLF